MRLRIHPSARKHGIDDKDIKHAVKQAISIDNQNDDLRLYLGPARDADLLEVGTVRNAAGQEVAVHAMKMRPKYRSFLTGGER